MKRELLLKILELTKLQAELLKEEKMEEFKNILEDRQVIMSQIDDLHKKYPELKLERHEDILKQLCIIEDENKKEFNRQLEKAKQKLREVRQMKKREDVYSNPYGMYREEGIFFDKK